MGREVTGWRRKVATAISHAVKMSAAAICPEARSSVRVMTFGGAWMSYRQLIGAWLARRDASLMISQQQLLSAHQSPPSRSSSNRRIQRQTSVSRFVRVPRNVFVPRLTRQHPQLRGGTFIFRRT